jgi:general secretion pathway protein D
VLKSTARILIGLIAVTVGNPGTFAFAQERSTGGYLRGPGTSSQASVARSGDARQQCDDLLKRARQAIVENNLSAANLLISQAESLGVQYGRLHMGDTPAKARAELARLSRASATGKRGLGNLLSIGTSRNTSTPADPFAARVGTGVSGSPADAKSVTKSYILKGRTELANGNLAAAAAWHRMAAQQRASFAPSEDSPQKLAAAILAAGGTLEASSQVGTTPRRNGLTPLPPVDQVRPVSLPSTGLAQSDSLLLSARRALATGDVRRASSFVQQVRALNLHYNPSDDNPSRVETLIRSYSDLKAQETQRGQTEAYRRQYATVLMQQANGLLMRQDFAEAERLASQAAKMNVPFGSYKLSPQSLLEQIDDLRQQARVSGTALAGGRGVPGSYARGVVQASGQHVTPANGNQNYQPLASRAVYDPANDRTRNRLAQNQQPVPAPMPAGAPGAATANSPGNSLFMQGDAALKAGDTEGALRYFRQAANYMNELDPVTRQRLQDSLLMLSASDARRRVGQERSLVDDAQTQQKLLARQVNSEVAHQESSARHLRETDPMGALTLLEKTREKVIGSGLDPINRDQLIRRIDRSIGDTRNYIEENQPRIELDERNKKVLAEIDLRRKSQQEVQEKLALMVEEYNQLMRDQRFPEAEVVAKRAKELDPTNPLATQLVLMASLINRHQRNLTLRGDKERGVLDALEGVDIASIPFNDMEPYVFGGDATSWGDLTHRRQEFLKRQGRQRSETEIEIEQRLRTPVLLEFENTPLSRVMDYLAKLAQVNLYLDPIGLAEVGLSTEDPVTITLSQEISLESALNIILEPRGLSFVVKDEVLKITTEENRQGEVYARTYNVADLVVPIPNFVNVGMGLSSAYNQAMANVAPGISPFGNGPSAMAMVASNSGHGSSAMVDSNILAQMSGGGPAGLQTPDPAGFGPGGLGGGSLADYDSLIDLITATVAPDTWEETTGGPGTIEAFDANLSLVIRQTEEVHEEIVDLLQQLRRMQDLQVTIEVRFITLNDNFFERIGVDFDFDIDDNIDRPFQVFGRRVDESNEDADLTVEPNRDTRDVDHDNGSVTVGMQAPGVFSADLDIPFTQNSFGLSVPQFGGFDASAGASLGFAILSDIEAFFFINAAQGDRRSNVLQAPKVTLFNGQMASVSDQSQSPFVVSVIPVVGDFAAAQQPVIVILSEGTFLSVQAVVSADRRFVRLTVVPFFSRIGDVDTFQFTGSETTTTSTSTEGIQDEPNDDSKQAVNSTITRAGTTVQLPTFSFVNVSTTVSVPDGGTVLLGGIKRLNEGRNEFGVPMLNKIPYISRLFKNVGIGRETQSLMMMVTPRIIIQEEEEERLGIRNPGT